MSNNDDAFAAEVIRTVADLTRKFEQYTKHADEERRSLIESVNGTVEAMRKDVFRAIIRLQLDASQHRDEHSAERNERAADAVDRLNRQLIWNVWMGALTALVVLNLLLIGFVVIQVVQVMYAR